MTSIAVAGGGGAAAKDFDRSEKSEYANRVSRLRGVMGAEALAKLSTSSVLIIGLGGLGVEIAKNVILTGVQSCTLYDKAPASHADLASQFFISEQDIGKPRAAVSLPQLRTLNPYTAVDVHEGAVDDAFIAQFTVVVATECSYERQLQLNDACRKGGVNFIATDTAGVFGRAFCDFGPSFVVADQDGEPAQECVLANVAVDAETGVATITVDEEKRLEVEKGDFVSFKEIRGGAAGALNGCEPKAIVERVDAFNFKVEGCDPATAGAAYEGGGIMQQVKQPRTMAFRTLRECLQSPGELVVSDFSKYARARCCFAMEPCSRALRSNASPILTRHSFHGALCMLFFLPDSRRQPRFTLVSPLSTLSKRHTEIFLNPLMLHTSRTFCPPPNGSNQNRMALEMHSWMTQLRNCSSSCAERAVDALDRFALCLVASLARKS